MLDFLLYKFAQSKLYLSYFMFFSVSGKWTKTCLQICETTSGQRELLFTRRSIKGPNATISTCKDRWRIRKGQAGTSHYTLRANQLAHTAPDNAGQLSDGFPNHSSPIGQSKSHDLPSFYLPVYCSLCDSCVPSSWHHQVIEKWSYS